jgi:hypothetical protein
MKYSYLIIILKLSLISSLRIEKLEEVSTLERKSKSHGNIIYHYHPNITDKLSNSTYRDLNNSLVKQEVKDFKENNHRWDFKLFDGQLEEIATIMTYKDQNYQTVDSKRAFLQQFLVPYDNCDKNNDNMLDKKEFSDCLKNDPYLSDVKPTLRRYALYANYSAEGDYGFYDLLLTNAASNGKNSTSFYDYMMIRLIAFAWKKCSVTGPFIDEIAYECALEVVAGYKTFSRNSAKSLYMLNIDFGNNE